MEIVFDPAKNARNLRERELPFERVVDFDFDSALFEEDARRDYDEVRIRAFRNPLHNSLRSVIARARAVHCVVFLANSWAIGCKKTPCGPSRSARHSLARVMQRVPSFLDGRLHALVFVETPNGIRVISFRKANAREVRHYHEKASES